MSKKINKMKKKNEFNTNNSGIDGKKGFILLKVGPLHLNMSFLGK